MYSERLISPKDEEHTWRPMSPETFKKMCEYVKLASQMTIICPPMSATPIIKSSVEILEWHEKDY
jgi:hypothetical protein